PSTAANVGNWSGASRVDCECRAHRRATDCFRRCLSGYHGDPNRPGAEYADIAPRFTLYIAHDRLYISASSIDVVNLLAGRDLTWQEAVPADARVGMASAIQMGSRGGTGVFDDGLGDCF